VDKSLVSVEESAGEARYHLLETLRHYARDRLAAGEEHALVRDRHRDYYVALAEEAEPALRGPEQARWLDRIAGDLGNVRAALGWCEQGPAGAEAGLRLARALWRFWELRGLLSEGRGWLTRMLAISREAAPLLRARAFNAAGTLAYREGDRPAASRCYAESLRLARAAGDAATIAASLSNLSLIHTDAGEIERARALLEEAIAIRRTSDDRWGISRDLNGLGYLALRAGDHVSAERFVEESLAVKREIGDTVGIAGALGNLAELAMRRGEYARAESLLRESLDLRRRLKDDRAIVATLCGLADMAGRQGDQSGAASRYFESLLLARRLEMPAEIAQALEGLAAIAATGGRFRDGARLLGAAEALRGSTGTAASSDEPEDRDRIVATLRAGLDEATFAFALAEGRAMTLDEVIARAIEAGSVP
jgi:tetratricopeptide (TPR) repeat protein